VGHTYAWEGNDDVGKGKPMAATNDTVFTVASRGESSVMVSWVMTGHNNFISKVFCVFMNLDEMVGKDFETGLATLKITSEAAARAAAAEAAAPPSGGLAPVSAP